MNTALIQNLLKDKENYTLVAITKYVPSSVIRRLYTLGVRDFGESKTKELLEKKEELKDLKDIRWHLIGHLQKNKVKGIINEIDYLHSLDSLDLAMMIQKYRIEPLNAFVEIKFSAKDTKHGISPDELDSFLQSLKEYDKIRIIGIMAMADEEMDDKEIDSLFAQAEEIKNRYRFPYLSLGMSHDYPLAIKHSSTHIRLGRILFDREEAKEDYQHYFDEE